MPRAWLMVPPLATATVPMLEALIALAQAGVPVLHGDLPTRHPRAPERLALDGEVARLSARLAALPAARMVSDDLPAALAATGIARDWFVAQGEADGDIAVLHRRIDGRDVYFIANGRRRAERVTLSLHGDASGGVLRDAAGERFAQAALARVAERTLLALDLPPSGSVVALRRPLHGCAHPALVAEDRALALMIDGEVVGRVIVVRDPVAGGEGPPSWDRARYAFHGDIAALAILPDAGHTEAARRWRAGLPPPEPARGRWVLSNGCAMLEAVSAPIAVAGPWQVDLPARR